jgi:tetratricopeptide (TPR) repeat protein
MIVPQPVLSTAPFPVLSEPPPRPAPAQRPQPPPRPVMQAPVQVHAEAPMDPLPPPTRPVRRAAPSGDYESVEPGPSMPPSMEEPYSVRRGRRVGGWIVALVLLGAAGVLGWAVAKPYLNARAAGAAAATQLDPRAEQFIAGGEKAIGEGNLEEAQEDLDKASALAEGDPRVRLDEARVSTAQADVPWLKLKLLAPTAADEIRMAKAQLDERVAKAGRLADGALTSAPDSPAAARVKLDALRLAGDQGGARALVAKVIAQASQPETAYVLAALDLAEPEPLWTTVLDRLRLAAAGEGNSGRARAALVYALAKSGDVSGAKAELAKLDALVRPYPLSPDLHALVEKAPAKVVDAGAEVAAAHPSAARPGAAPAPAPAPAPAAAGDSVPNDSRSAMQLASAAYKKGDFSRAQQIYEAIVTRNPGDSEALASLGDVARAQGDLAGAIASYKRAISVNPSYLPALLGQADTQWASGERSSAVKSYGDIVDRFPEGTYPGYVKQRVDGANGAAPADPKPSSAAPTSEESSP